MLLGFLVLMILGASRLFEEAHFLELQDLQAQARTDEDGGAPLQKALDLRAAGNYQEALTALRELLKQDPDSVRVRLELAALHLDLGNPDFAHEFLRPIPWASTPSARAGQLRVRAGTQAAERILQSISRPGWKDSKQLQQIETAEAIRKELSEKIPPKASAGLPEPDRVQALRELRRLTRLAEFKRAQIKARGTRQERQSATETLKQLEAEKDLSPPILRAVRSLQKVLEGPGEIRPAAGKGD